MQYCRYRRDNVAFTKKPLKWSAVGIEPSEEKKVQGFGNGEYPAAGHFDFKFHSDYEVIQELQEKAGEVKSINGQLPDEKGNIKVNVDTSNLATKEELKTKYSKPLDGIPKTDLAREVQTSLTKADGSAKQTDLEALNEKVAEHQADNAKHVPHLGTTTGSGDNFSISTTEKIEVNQKFTIKFNADSGASPVLVVSSASGVIPKPIKKSNGNYAKLYASVYTLFYDGENFILQGEGASGNATASDLLSGKTASTDAGDIIGTIPSKSAQTYTPRTTNQAISSGQYLNGTQTILGDANLISGNIISGKSIFGVSGSAQTLKYANGTAMSGPDTGKLTTGDIGQKYATITVTGLSFTPDVIFVYSDSNPKLLAFHYPFGFGVSNNHGFYYNNAYYGISKVTENGVTSGSTNGGFMLPIPYGWQNQSLNWVAYGK